MADTSDFPEGAVEEHCCTSDAAAVGVAAGEQDDAVEAARASNVEEVEATVQHSVGVGVVGVAAVAAVAADTAVDHLRRS
jgi:hypothetical protein